MGKVKPSAGPKNAMAPKEDEAPHEYEIREAADTLSKAEEIKKDKRLMPHVHKHISKKITSLKELRKLANQAHIETDGESEQKSLAKKEFNGDVKDPVGEVN